MADVPGLIPGASSGKGLGLRFLRHLERTRLLVHLLDLDPDTGRDPVDDWRTIQAELETYSPELAARPQLIAANKIDLEGAGPRLATVAAFGRGRGLPVIPIAARTGRGLDALRVAIGAALLAADPVAGAPA
jgi:GTP-binding protein